MASKRVGVVDATKLPTGKPTGIVSATEFSSSALENAVDVTKALTSPDPPRGTKRPTLGPHRPR
jgi:hypothetical protein